MHPFTGIQITDKGIAWLSDWVGQIRETIGMEIPLASDHYGHIGVNSCIKLARAMEHGAARSLERQELPVIARFRRALLRLVGAGRPRPLGRQR